MSSTPAPPVAVVSAAADGIGLAVTATLARAGYAVGMIDVRGDRLAASVDRLRREGHEVEGHEVDVTDAPGVAAAVAAVADRWGPVTTGVSGVGIAPYAELLDMPVQQWRRVLDVNLTGTFIVTTEVARVMVATGTRGSLCCVSSGAGLLGRVGAAAYSTTKAGLHMYTKVLAMELGSRGIRVNAVAPGFIDHGHREGLGSFSSPAYVAANRATVPLDRTGTAQDVADAVAYLCSPAAAFVSGAVLTVDGGSTAGKYGIAWDDAAPGDPAAENGAVPVPGPPAPDGSG